VILDIFDVFDGKSIVIQDAVQSNDVTKFWIN